MQRKQREEKNTVSALVKIENPRPASPGGLLLPARPCLLTPAVGLRLTPCLVLCPAVSLS